MKKIVLAATFIVNMIACSFINASEFESTISPITSEIKSRMIYSWKEDSPISLEDLRYVTLVHYDFSGEVKKGEIVVHKEIAQDIVNIFKELFENQFPLTSMKLIDEFPANTDNEMDECSMEANNSSAHFCRKVARTNRWSNHATGLAIDINPRLNPWMSKTSGKFSPKNAEDYVNRSEVRVGMITKDSLIYTLFIEHGFEWGGECFPGYLDLHHFQKIIPGLNKTQN